MDNFDTLFLDRDGVINKKLEARYVRNFSEFEFINGALEALSELTKVPKLLFEVLIYSGASFSIANILYLAFSTTGVSFPCDFLRIKKSSSMSLFLSEEGNDSHIFSSSALYHRSIAKV